MLFVCKCGGRQFAICFLAPPHPKPVTAMLLFNSDVQQYMICKSGGAHRFATMHHTHIHTHTHTHTPVLLELPTWPPIGS